MPRSNRGINAIAVFLLACAIASAYLSFRAGEEASSPHGPQALAVVGERVWIADGESLLAVDREGHVLQEYPFTGLGVESVGSINAVDDRRMLVASRGSLTLRLLDGDARLLRTIPLRFPGGLERQQNHTLWLASTPVDSEGHFRIAVATGGNHAVALFDDQGHFLARTRDGLYRYTNGIWYADGSWWTTDTNRYTLRRLALNALEQTEQIQLGADHTQRYLGAAIASRGASSKLGQPLGTLFRLQNDMSIGRVVDVFPDGREIEYPLPPDAEPMDMVWLGNKLLVAEGQSTTILRFDATRRPLGEFGDFSLRQRFQKMAEQRTAAEQWHMTWLYGAGASLVVALFFVGLARRAPISRTLLESHPALPVPDWRTQLRVVAPSIGPSLAFLGFAVLLGAYGKSIIEWTQHQRELPPVILMSMIQIAIVAGALAILAWGVRQAGRQCKLPEFEPLFNLGALVWLNRNQAWRELCRDKEFPVEVLQTFVPNDGYLLLTNQRLLHFRRNRSVQPDAAWERRNIVSAVLSEEPPDACRTRRLATPTAFAYLNIAAANNQVTIYRIVSCCTATRICAHLSEMPGDPSTPDKPRQGIQDSGEIGKPWLQTLCAAVIPGLGQWMQRRNAVALVFFLIAALIFTFMLFPLAMTLVNGSADVCPSVEWKYAKVWGFLSLMSAFDAWSMARRNIT